MHGQAKLLYSASILICLLILGCSSQQNEIVIPTLMVLPDDTAPSNLNTTHTNQVATQPPTVDPAISRGVDQLFTQTAQAYQQLAPTETVIAAFNQALTSTAAAAQTATQSSVELTISAIEAREATVQMGTVQAATATRVAQVPTETAFAELKATSDTQATQTFEHQITATVMEQSQLRVITVAGVSSLETIATFDGNNLSFSPDGTLFAIVNGLDVSVYNTNSLQPILSVEPTFANFPFGVIEVAISLDNSMLAITSQDSVYVWDIRTGEVLHRFQDEDTESFTNLVFDMSGTKLVSGNNEGEIIVWSLSRSQIERVTQIAGYCDLVDIRLRTDGDLIVLCSDSMRVIDIDSGQETQNFRVMGTDPLLFDAPYSLSLDGSFLAISRSVFSNNVNAIITLRNMQSGRTRDLSIFGFVEAFTLSPDGTILAVSEHDLLNDRNVDTGISFFGTTSGTRLSFIPLESATQQLTFSPGNRLFAFAENHIIYLMGVR